ncbi:PAS domain-containing sensor histidine kinase [Roseisolibacter agri]|uniref:histidine kinase n=1 Tax=Roseisolibacter agri TaxID=2014610 RepID=A0AA37VE75_9BACT|nr:PAS domain-containing protein [Roseisolibacter agri]GLC24719.1 hypothetical protein rosag_12320 [Roseisolibacter agri]
MSSLEQGAAGSESASGEGAAERRAAAEERRARDRSVMAVVEGMSDAFLSLDRDWRVTYANREAARLNGTSPAALVGRDHWTVWPETAGTEVERQYRRAIAEGVPVTFEHHYPAADVWHEIRAYPAEEGGLAVFYRDVTARKRLEEERARQARALAAAHDKAMAAEAQFRLLVDRVRDYAIFLMDPHGVVTHWGPGAERMTGWRAEAMTGQPVHRLYPAGGAEDGGAEDHLRHAALHGEYTGEGARRRRDATAFVARVVLTALREGGRLVGFSMIMQDLTAEREREATLERAIAAAETASTAKSQFLATTSHEIRTPLNAIIGYAELLDMGLGGTLTESQRAYVARIQATSRHLLALVNDVLDLAKIEAGQMHAAREPALVRDAVSAALQLVEPQARARRIALVNGCTEQTTTAYCGDAARVRQVLANLLSNAVRFTEAGGRVTVTCGEADAAAPEAAVAHAGAPGAPGAPGATRAWSFVRVEDTGVGIPPEQLERIWEAFVQADQGRTRRVGGSGLGLTISRHLARLMGGDITVRSQPGLGSSFMLWLPAADEEAVARARDAARGAADAATAAPVRVPGAARDAAGLHAVADALLGETERMLTRYAAALRTEPATPSAHGLGDAQLLDHTATFLADLAQSLTVIGEDGPDAAQMLRDGSTIQQLIAARHGAQRARLGWSEAEVRRDYEVLRETVHDTVRRLTPAAPDVARALGIVDTLLARAVEECLRAFREPR